MADNVYKKLITARAEFLKAGVDKSGKNMGIGYKYFELEDIIPKATEIFNRLGLVAMVSFTETDAIMELVNIDKPDEKIVFTSPMRTLQSNKGMNEVQALGSVQTYLRRYLYITCLDICEADEIDADKMPQADKPVASQVVVPNQKVEEKREAIKQALTNNAAADGLQLKSLKKLLKQLSVTSPENEKKVVEIIQKTNNLTTIDKNACEILIAQVSKQLGEIKPKGAEISPDELPF